MVSADQTNTAREPVIIFMEFLKLIFQWWVNIIQSINLTVVFQKLRCRNRTGIVIALEIVTSEHAQGLYHI